MSLVELLQPGLSTAKGALAVAATPPKICNVQAVAGVFSVPHYRRGYGWLFGQHILPAERMGR